MGYPMPYYRLIGRNDLKGGYDTERPPHMDLGTWRVLAGIRGDMRRFETDSLDDRHLTMYAEYVGITTDQARTFLRALFDWNTPEFREWQRANDFTGWTPPETQAPGPFGACWQQKETS